MAIDTDTTFDIEALKRALEAHDFKAVLDFYANDAEIRIVDKDSPPKAPKVLKGRDAYAELLDDVAQRDLTTRVERAIVGSGGAALCLHCRYGDGTEVIANQILDLRQGEIVRQLEVLAWDE